MDKNHLTTEIHTTSNINCPSSSITLTIPNKTYLNEHVSKNILSDLSPLCNLKETDENE
ncbi:unnamed protein product, partial [Rotaria sordida]